MTDTSNIIELKDVRFGWPGRASFSISIPSFTLKRGETALLLGESGSGKSTLLSLICGSIAPQQGRVEVDKTDITTLPASTKDRFRAETIGIVFQQFNLLPFGTVSENIRLPLRFAPQRKQRTGDAGHAVIELCKALQLPPELITAKAGTLSVGQQQRVAVARALIGTPPLIIADEPTSSLDATSQSAFLDMLFSEVSANSQSLMMVSHDPRIADRFDTVLKVEDILTSERVSP